MSDFFKDTLANGLRVLTVPMPHLHAVEMMFFIGVGSRNEASRVAGVSHFLEHMLFRGCEDYPTGPELERAFEAIGGYVNAATDVETTCYHSRVHPDHVDRGTALFGQMLRAPLMPDFETERRVILEEALEDLNAKGEDVNPDNLTAALLWPGHPLGRPTIGTRASIEGLTLDDLKKHHSIYYRPVNVVAVAAGRVGHDRFLQSVERYFGGWQSAPVPDSTLFVAPTDETEPESVWVRDSGSQVSLQLAFRIPGRTDANNMALRLLRRVLSGGGSARLMQRLREELGLTYAVDAQMATVAETGSFSIDLALMPDNVEQAVEEVLAMLVDLCRNPVPQKELDGIRRGFLYELEFSCDFTEEMAARYGWGEMVGQVRTLEQERRDVAAITPEMLREAACRTFRRETLKLAAAGPWSSEIKRRVNRRLQAFDPHA
ncbi:MAG: M16 family metallopeptidase [Geoalkalibacter sp.]|jgi:predicted Zn-dependent peptidase|uniref:M16 family metallopeptidase n=1 Tax=Geoalkalibacter sp. TaxID=3041440 RepID=UPI002A9CD57D|nr:pitrilysin family protein [Thermodesulfobacteriota bacterium]